MRLSELLLSLLDYGVETNTVFYVKNVLDSVALVFTIFLFVSGFQKGMTFDETVINTAYFFVILVLLSITALQNFKLIDPDTEQ